MQIFTDASVSTSQMKKKKYNIPVGYSFLQTAFKSNKFIENPVAFITKSIERFGPIYSASLGVNRKIIITKNAGFINYVLKDNQKNYKKSEFLTERAVELFGNGLLFSNGDYWRAQRRFIQPAFHKEKIHGLYENVIKSIREFLIDFPTGENIDVYPLVQQLSFNALLKSLFDINLSDAIIKELNNIFSDLQEFLIKDINQPIGKIFYPITGLKKKYLNKAKRLREIFIDIIKERKKSKEHFSDLLDMLLNSKYEDTGEAMTEEQITDELIILIFAGHETTGNTLSWLLYLIGSNEIVLKKLNDSFINTNIQDCINNEYLKATINEGMRLYPAAWMTDRVAIEDDEFEGISYPKNTIIISFFFGVHRDNNLWDDAAAFKPDRFIIDDKVIKAKNYFPFGAGPRMCIGNNFAMAEMCFFLFEFLNNFNIKYNGIEPEMKPLITLRPQKVLLSVKRK